MSFIPHHPPGMHPLDDLDLDSAPGTLPVEVIERVVDFLQDDTHALTTCSLTCRGLLPAARKHIWYAVHIPVIGDRKPKTRRLAGFLTLLDANPNLHPYVRSLTWAWTSFCGSKPSWFGFKDLRLWEKLPNLRTLKFYRISFFVIDPIIELCRTFPHLEELVPNSISAVAVGPMWTPTQDQATRGTRKLKRLSISGAMSPKHVSAVAEALLVEQLHASLEVLDLRCVVYLSAPSGRMPSEEALHTQIARRARGFVIETVWGCPSRDRRIFIRRFYGAPSCRKSWGRFLGERPPASFKDSDSDNNPSVLGASRRGTTGVPHTPAICIIDVSDSNLTGESRVSRQ